MKYRILRKTVQLLPFPRMVTMLITNDIEHTLAKLGGVEDASGWLGFMTRMSNGNYVLCVHAKASPGMVAHEASHVIVDLFGQLSISINYSGDETFAYHIQRVVDTTIELQKKFNTRKPKWSKK